MTTQPISRELLPLKRKLARASIPVHVFHRFQERIRNPRMRKKLSDAIAFFRPKSRAVARPDIAVLNHDGVMMFSGYMSAEQAGTPGEVLLALPCRDPWAPEKGTFAVKNAPIGTHVADIAAAPLLKTAYNIAINEQPLAIAAEYFGSVPYVDSIQARWSLSGNDEPEEAGTYHRQRRHPLAEALLCLTDVGDKHGPHKFMKGSHADNRLLGTRRLTDEEVEATFCADRVVSMNGRTGDVFIEDTFGLYQGQLPASGTRLLLQVRYSITPTIFRSRLTVAEPAPTRASNSISLIHEG